MTIVAKFSSKHLRKVTTQQAKLFGVRLIDPVDTPNIMKAICDNLRENRIVITQCDEIEAWRPSHNTRIEFLGKQIYLDKVTNVLAKRVKSAINFTIMHRNKHHRYKIYGIFIGKIVKAILVFKRYVYRSTGIKVFGTIHLQIPSRMVSVEKMRRDENT